MSKALQWGIEIRIEAGQCVGCAICADVCPSRALTMGSEDLLPAWWAGRCSACGDCARECPTGAVWQARRHPGLVPAGPGQSGMVATDPLGGTGPWQAG